MTDQPTVVLSLNAANTVEGPVLPVRPVLFLRCHEEVLEAFVQTGSVLRSEDAAGSPDHTSVRIRWGAAAPVAELWSRSTNYEAAFALDPAAFLRQLLATPDLRFEFHPFDATPSVATFNARGLDRHLPTLERACPSLKAPLKGQKDVDRKTDTTLVLLDDATGRALGRVFMESELDQRPEILSGPPLQYPDLLRQAGIQGRVIVQVIVDTSGRVEPASVKVVQSPNPGFDQSVRTYVLGALFRPARMRGRAVRVLVNIPIDFKVGRRP